MTEPRTKQNMSSHHLLSEVCFNMVMSSSSLRYNQIEQMVGFLLHQKLTSSQRSLLISDLLHYNNLSGLRLIDNDDSVLTVLKEDIGILHTTSSTAPLFDSELSLPDPANHERIIGSLLDAQCPSALKILREDIRILHTSSVGQPCSLQESIPQQAQLQARWLPPSIESVGFSESFRVKIVEQERKAANHDTLFTGCQNPAAAANELLISEGKRILAYAPPLSGSTSQTPGFKRKRPVAADFFPLDSASKIAPTKPEKDICRDVEELIEGEKAMRDNFTGPWCQRKKVDDHVKDTVQPPSDDNNNRPPSRDYPHDETESNIIGLTAIEESMGEQSSHNLKLTRSPMSVSSPSQRGKTTMRNVPVTAASSHGTPTSSQAEHEPAVKRRKRTRAPKESKKCTWMGNRYTEPEPEKLSEIPIPLLL
ncbi:hypothetical protein XANCAGTX0491_006647 [Xanthoria calcicola]